MSLLIRIRKSAEAHCYNCGLIIPPLNDVNVTYSDTGMLVLYCDKCMEDEE